MKFASAHRVWLAFGLFATVAMAIPAAWLIRSQGQQLPVMDEWGLLPEAMESESDWSWYFLHHNEHRFPITKALWLGTLRATNFNFQAPMFVALALLASASVLAQWTAADLRGRAHPFDAIFAVIFLHFGHAFTFLMGYQLGFALFAYGAVGWLWSVGKIARGGGLGWRLLSALFAAFLVQCGGFGIGFSPFLAVWYGCLALRDFRSARPISGGFAFLFAIFTLSYSTWVYATMPKFMTEEGLNPLESPVMFCAAIVGYLSSGLGQWPAMHGGALRIATGILVAAAFLAAGLAATRAVLQRPERRCIALALLAIGLGSVAVGIAAAKARGGGWTERYAAPAAAGWAAVALAAIAFPPTSKRWRTWGGGAVLAFGAATIWFNLDPGLRFAYYMRISLWEMQRDLDEGLPSEYLGGRYGGTLGVFVGDLAPPLIRRLHKAGVPQFRKLAPDPIWKAVPVEGVVEPIIILKEDGERIGPGGTIPGMIFRPPVGAMALRMHATTVKSAGWHRLTAVWIDPKTGVERRADAHPHSTLVSIHLIFPFEGRPNTIRVTFASAVQELRIDEVEWLVSETLR